MKRVGLSSRAPDVGERPQASPNRVAVSEITFEIGVTLALHLAVAFAIVMTLRAFGIA